MAKRSGTRVRVLYNKFEAIARRMPDVAMNIVEETLTEVDQFVKMGMAAGGSGRVYIRGGRSHRASAPGAMPARDTGQLAASLQHEIVRGKYTGYYYSNSEIAPHLEYGTSRMRPRPFLTPAAERARAAFMRKMKNLEDGLR